MANQVANKELFNSIQYTILPFIFCGFPRRKNQYHAGAINETQTNNNMFDICFNNGNIATYENEYEFHFNTVKLEISCEYNNLLYGIYPLRLINWLTTQVKRKLLYKNACRLTDKYEFYAEVLGAIHPSAKDVETLNQAFNSLANAKFTIKTSKSTYENISIFDGDVSWLWNEANQWQPSLSLSNEFIELASKHSCPISKKAQYDLYGSELILFNFFMYQNYCLNESARNYTYHINQLMDVLQMPCNGSVSLKNNKYKIVELCNRIKAKTGLKLNYINNGIEVQPNVDALLVQPLKTIKTVTGKVILSQKEINIYSKAYSDLDVARAMYCVQYRINNGLTVDNPKKYMWWFLKEKDGKAAKSMYKAGLALKDALYKKYKTISVNGDTNNPSQAEMIAALDINAPNNKPTANMLSEWQRHDAIECYKLLNHHLNHYKQFSDSKPLEQYMYHVWLISTQQIIPQELLQSVDMLLQIPKVKQLAEKYKKSKQQLSELEDLSNFLFGGQQCK